MSDPGDLPEELLNAPVRFWMCINREHKSVTWDDSVATCPDCGLTSEMTKRYSTVLRVTLAELLEAERQRIGEDEAATAKGEDVITGIVNGLGRAIRIVRGES